MKNATWLPGVIGVSGGLRHWPDKTGPGKLFKQFGELTEGWGFFSQSGMKGLKMPDCGAALRSPKSTHWGLLKEQGVW